MPEHFVEGDGLGSGAEVPVGGQVVADEVAEVDLGVGVAHGVEQRDRTEHLRHAADVLAGGGLVRERAVGRGPGEAVAVGDDTARTVVLGARNGRLAPSSHGPRTR